MQQPNTSWPPLNPEHDSLIPNPRTHYLPTTQKPPPSSTPSPLGILIEYESLPDMQAELKRRIRLCYQIEKELRTLKQREQSQPSRAQEIEAEHHRQMQQFETGKPTESPAYDAASTYDDTPSTVAKLREDEEIRKQFERGSIYVGVPDPEQVNSMFKTIAHTERDMMNEAMQMQEPESTLEQRLLEARSSYFELEDRIKAMQKRAVEGMEGNREEASMPRDDGNKQQQSFDGNAKGKGKGKETGLEELDQKGHAALPVGAGKKPRRRKPRR